MFDDDKWYSKGRDSKPFVVEVDSNDERNVKHIRCFVRAYDEDDAIARVKSIFGFDREILMMDDDSLNFLSREGAFQAREATEEESLSSDFWS